MKKFCILVLFNPDVTLMTKTVYKLLDQDICIYIVDNTPIENEYSEKDNSLFDELRNNEKVNFLKRIGNVGLSMAYNLAIEEIVKFNENPIDSDGVLFLDQDSLIEAEDISELFESFLKLPNDVAILGGNPVRRDGQPYREYKSPLNEVSIVISSFSIIKLSALNKIGLFQSDFFIDHIDVDFCARCRRMNMKVMILRNATFIQPIGTKPFSLFGKYLFPVPSASRTYYQIRNALLSYKRGGVDFKFLSHEFRNRFIISFLSGISERDLFERLRLFFLGVYHGLLNRGGEKR